VQEYKWGGGGTVLVGCELNKCLEKRKVSLAISKVVEKHD